MAYDRKQWTTIGLLAGAGGLCGFFGAQLAMDGDGRFFLPGADEPTFVLAILLLLAGVMVLFTMTSTQRIKAMMCIPEEEEDVSQERKSLVLQSATFMLAAVALLITSVAGVNGINPTAGYAAVLIVIIVQTVLNIQLWKTSDEMMRGMIMEGSAIAFWVFQSLLFLWAAAEAFGFAIKLSSLHVYDVLMFVYLIAGGIVGNRRGFGNPAPAVR